MGLNDLPSPSAMAWSYRAHPQVTSFSWPPQPPHQEIFLLLEHFKVPHGNNHWSLFVFFPGMVIILFQQHSGQMFLFFLYFKKDFIYLFFRVRGRKGKRGEKNWSVAFHMCLHQAKPASPGMCPDQESNRWPFDLGDRCPTNWATPVRAFYF